MDCRSCELPDAKKAREAALALLRTPGTLPQTDRDMALACCQCYSDRMVAEVARIGTYEN